MAPCTSKFNCTCLSNDWESDNHHTVLILQFKNISSDVKKQEFIERLITGSCDPVCFKRCFEIDTNKFLCRFGLSKLLKLTKREFAAVVPSAKQISQRNKIICITEIFSAYVSYRTTLLKLPPTRRDNTFIERVEWSHPCFAEAVKKVQFIPGYRANGGIAKFVSNLQITSAIKNKKIILSAVGDNHLNKFITLVSGCVFDLTTFPGFHVFLDDLDLMIQNIPPRYWQRVAKHSLSVLNGGQIEYTSSPQQSLDSWMSSFCTRGKLLNLQTKLKLTIELFQKHIMQSISHFVFQTDEHHVVCLQPGALRSLPGTVPQKAHRDFTSKIYKDKFPGQVFIGFMPVTRDGMFLQIWNGPGEAKLVFIPYGKFLFLPGNTVHAGWMCTSTSTFNRRLHFYILVSKDPKSCNRKETYFFENMNTYHDEESDSKPELYSSHFNALMNQKITIGL
jgi:hypothetical protein